MKKKGYSPKEFPINVWFDGSFLSNNTGIGRDSRNILKAINQISNLKINITSKKNSITHKIIRSLKLVILKKPEYINIPPNTIFIQSHIHNFLPKGENITHVIRTHDLFPITNPEWFRRASAYTFRNVFKSLSKQAFYVCDSKTTRNDLLNLGIPAKSTDVLYCPVQIANSSPCKQCRGCIFDSRKSYILTVGTIEPRKNYLNLISAWQNLSSESKNGFTLVIVGKPGWKSKETLKILRSQKNGSDIAWLESICDFSLIQIIRNSGCVLSNSLNEGFNLPLAEALEFGKSIVVSDIPVHREIYGDSAHFYLNHPMKEISKGLLEAIRISSRESINHNELYFDKGIESVASYFEKIIFKFSKEKSDVFANF